MKLNADATSSPTQGQKPFYRLLLFVAGEEPNSRIAKANLAHICETHLRECCQLVIIDVLENYQAAIDYQVMVVPTLIVESPPPTKTIVGSLSNEAKLLVALGIPEFGPIQ